MSQSNNHWRRPEITIKWPPSGVILKTLISSIRCVKTGLELQLADPDQISRLGLVTPAPTNQKTKFSYCPPKQHRKAILSCSFKANLYVHVFYRRAEDTCSLLLPPSHPIFHSLPLTSHFLSSTLLSSVSPQLSPLNSHNLFSLSILWALLLAM